MSGAKCYTVHADALTLALAARTPDQVAADRARASSILNIGESSWRDVPLPSGTYCLEVSPEPPITWHGRTRKRHRREWKTWAEVNGVPGCWSCGVLPGDWAHKSGCEADREPQDRRPPVMPPFFGRGAEVPGTYYSPAFDQEDGKAWKPCDTFGSMAYVDSGRQAYTLAVAELRRQGRKRKASRVETCGAKAAVIPYYCAGCQESHHRIVGACGLKCCPGCSEREYRKTRHRVWSAFGRVNWAHTWTITCPPELRQEHTPERFTAWAGRVATALDAWALARWGIRLAYFISAHWTGEKRAAEGVFAPHLNLVLLGRCAVVATDRDERGRLRALYPLAALDLNEATGGYFHIRKGEDRKGREVWYGQTEVDREELRNLLGYWAFPGLAPDRRQAHLEVKPTPAAVAHAVRYNLRPAGDGRPDLLARWTWDGCRDVRVGGCLSSRWSTRWLYLNPADRATKAQEVAAVAPGTLAYITCAEKATPDTGPEFCRALEAERLDGSTFFPDRELALAVQDGDRERIERVVRDIFLGIPPASDDQVHDPPPVPAQFEAWRKRVQAEAIEETRKGWHEFYQAEKAANESESVADE